MDLLEFVPAAMQFAAGSGIGVAISHWIRRRGDATHKDSEAHATEAQTTNIAMQSMHARIEGLAEDVRACHAERREMHALLLAAHERERKLQERETELVAAAENMLARNIDLQNELEAMAKEAGKEISRTPVVPGRVPLPNKTNPSMPAMTAELIEETRRKST